MKKWLTAIVLAFMVVVGSCEMNSQELNSEKPLISIVEIRVDNQDSEDYFLYIRDDDYLNVNKTLFFVKKNEESILNINTIQYRGNIVVLDSIQHSKAYTNIDINLKEHKKFLIKDSRIRIY